MPKTSKKASVKTTKHTKKTPVERPRVLPGYMRFSHHVLSILNTYRSASLRLILLASIFSLLLTGLTSYAYYSGLTQATDEVAGQLPTGVHKTIVEVGALTISVVSGAANATLGEAQQVFTGILYLFLWLVTVWLLRHWLSDSVVKLRDGLYSAAAPLVSTCLVVLAGMVQLLPFALVVSLVAAVAATGSVNGFVWAISGTVLVVLFAALTLYWLVSTVFAAVIVTLPGTYPWAALRSAKQVIAGYRRQVILRLLWLGLMVFIAMFGTVSTVVLLDALTGYRLSVLVVVVSQLASVVLFVYSSAYVYLLYRGVIDERS